MQNVIRGRVRKYGANINTDLITPAYTVRMPMEVMLQHLMEGVDPEFAKKVQPGDILVAGPNFGSGSSRESAPRCLKAAGISAVISPLFARIFYRNAINIGLPVLSLQDTDGINDGDELEIDPLAGTIKNLTTGRQYTCDRYTENIMELIRDGGLIAHLEKQFASDENR